jgi:beta-lactamase regulating signal transducer with metallopeptidase domain
MNPIELLLDKPFFQTLGWTLLHFIWQGALVAILLANLNIFLRRRAASLRYALSCAAMLLMLALPVATFIAGQAAPSALTLQSVAARTDDTEAARAGAAGVLSEVSDASTPPRRSSSLSLLPALSGSGELARRLSGLLPWMTALWLSGVMLLSLRVAGGWMCAQRLKRRQTNPAGEDWQEMLHNLCVRMRVSKPVRLCQSLLVEVPTVIGWLEPVILVPVRALTGLTPQQLEALLAHELAHIRRHDYLVNLLQTVVETLLFYHPAVWWVSHQVRVERENCCDDVAVEACGDVLVYARALAELEHLRMGYDAPALAVAASGASLTQRIGRLVKLPPPRTYRSSSWLACLITMATVCCVWAGAASVGTKASPKNEGPAAPPVAVASAADVPSTEMPPAMSTPLDHTQEARAEAAERAAQEDEEHDSEPESDETETPIADTAAVVEDEDKAITPPAPQDEAGADADAQTETDAQTQEGSGDFISELAAEGYTKLSVEKIVALKIHGVSRAFIRQMKALGFRDLSVDNLLAMRIHGVSAATVEMLKGLGFDNLTPDQLVAARIHGVTPAFVQQMKSHVRGNLSLEKLTALRIHGISGDYIESLKAAGFASPSADQLVAARIHGVTPAFIKAMREAGYDKLSLEKLVALRIFGVTPEFVRKVRSRGFDDLTVEQLIELKRLGIIKSSAGAGGGARHLPQVH